MWDRGSTEGFSSLNRKGCVSTSSVSKIHRVGVARANRVMKVGRECGDFAFQLRTHHVRTVPLFVTTLSSCDVLLCADVTTVRDLLGEDILVVSGLYRIDPCLYDAH